MDYEKLYRDALERAEALYDNESSSADTLIACEAIFPELVVSEDEKVRKEIISALKRANHKGVYDKHITWLEKQVPADEDKVVKGVRRDVALSIMNYLDRNTLGMRLSSMERSDLESAVVDSDWCKVYDYMKKKLDEQGEQKPTLPKWKYKKDHTPLLRDSIILNKYGCVAKSPSGAIISDAWVLDYDELAKLPKEELEKQGEQKPFDDEHVNIRQKDFAPKIEPKFHEGDWIISNNKKSTYQVIEVKRGIYVIRDNVDNHEYHIGIEEAHKSGRLWTIKDAKDGDVLVCDVGEKPFIFNGLLDPYRPNCPVAYCGIDPEEIFCVSVRNYWWTDENVKPATKEQRNLLFQKMHEDGYEWDSENKELKVIKIKGMTDTQYLDNALDFIVEREQDGDYICCALHDIPKEYKICSEDCQNLCRNCVLRFLKNYKKGGEE